MVGDELTFAGESVKDWYRVLTAWPFTAKAGTLLVQAMPTAVLQVVKVILHYAIMTSSKLAPSNLQLQQLIPQLLHGQWSKHHLVTSNCMVITFMFFSKQASTSIMTWLQLIR